MEGAVVFSSLFLTIAAVAWAAAWHSVRVEREVTERVKVTGKYPVRVYCENCEEQMAFPAT